MNLRTPEQIAAEIVKRLHFSSNRMVDGKLVGEQHFAMIEIAEAIRIERDHYESAIQHCERGFARNKSRMWVLKILRERLRERQS